MRAPLPSRAPLVVDELLKLLEAALPASVELIDGPHAGDDSTLANDVMLVGHGDGENPGVTSSFERAGGLGGGYVEQVETVCVISSYAGDEAMKPRRDRAAELFALTKKVLDENVQVAGVWDHARLGDQVLWYPAQTGEGASCAVGFTIVTRSAI